MYEAINHYLGNGVFSYKTRPFNQLIIYYSLLTCGDYIDNPNFDFRKFVLGNFYYTLDRLKRLKNKNIDIRTLIIPIGIRYQQKYILKYLYLDMYDFIHEINQSHLTSQLLFSSLEINIKEWDFSKEEIKMLSKYINIKYDIDKIADDNKAEITKYKKNFRKLFNPINEEDFKKHLDILKQSCRSIKEEDIQYYKDRWEFDKGANEDTAKLVLKLTDINEKELSKYNHYKMLLQITESAGLKPPKKMVNVLY